MFGWRQGLFVFEQINQALMFVVFCVYFVKR